MHRPTTAAGAHKSGKVRAGTSHLILVQEHRHLLRRHFLGSNLLLATKCAVMSNALFSERNINQQKAQWSQPKTTPAHSTRHAQQSGSLAYPIAGLRPLVVDVHALEQHGQRCPVWRRRRQQGDAVVSHSDGEHNGHMRRGSTDKQRHARMWRHAHGMRTEGHTEILARFSRHQGCGGLGRGPGQVRVRSPPALGLWFGAMGTKMSLRIEVTSSPTMTRAPPHY